MATAATFRISVVTPEREVLATEATSVSLPAFDGELGVLAHRAPFLAKLGAGILRVADAAGAERRLFVAGGFAQMVDDRLTLLTEEASEPAELDAAAATAAIGAAGELPNRTETEHARRQKALDRARALRRSVR
ncbi:MAG: ATP synthase F1 subunit epsilon [Thermoanaerobaculia bacterium]